MEEKFQFIYFKENCHFAFNEVWLKNKCKIDCEINEYFLKEFYYNYYPGSSVYTEIHLAPSYNIHMT